MPELHFWTSWPAQLRRQATLPPQSSGRMGRQPPPRLQAGRQRRSKRSRLLRRRLLALATPPLGRMGS